MSFGSKSVVTAIASVLGGALMYKMYSSKPQKKAEKASGLTDAEVKENVRLIRENWAVVETVMQMAMDAFYVRLFEIDSSCRPLFSHTNMSKQAMVTGTTISKAVELLTDLPTLVPILKALGGRHVGYGVKAQHYDAVGQALIDTLSSKLGAAFTPAHKAAWVWVYGIIASTMQSSDEQIKENVRLIRENWKVVSTVMPVAMEAFYNRMFEIDPSTRALFKEVNMPKQAMALGGSLSFAIDMLDDLNKLVPTLKELGSRHVGYGVQAGHYNSAGQALIETLSSKLGAAFTPSHKAAWIWVFGIISSTMQSK